MQKNIDVLGMQPISMIAWGNLTICSLIHHLISVESLQKMVGLFIPTIH